MKDFERSDTFLFGQTRGAAPTVWMSTTLARTPLPNGRGGGGSLTENDVVRREQERDGDDDEEGDVGEAGARQGEEMADEGRGVDDEQS